MLVPSQSTAEHVNGNRNVTHCKHGHEFNETNTYISTQGRRHCRVCHRDNERRRLENNVDATQRNRDRVKSWIRNNPEKARETRQNWLASLRAIINEKKASGCEKCGETHMACLGLHHNDPRKKLFNIGATLGSISLKRLKAELPKTSVLCANCHRILHATERNKES